MRLVLIALSLMWLLAACDTVEPVQFDEQVVVESYLVLGEQLPAVRLSRSAPIGETYDVQERALSGASVFVHRIGAGGTTERAIRYAESDRQPGLYRPMEGETVRELTRYRLEATLADGRVISTETLVPGGFQLLDASTDTLYYQTATQLVLQVSASTYPGRQSVYILTTESYDPTLENLTPVYRSLVDDGTIVVEDLRVGASPLLNEANYDQGEQGQVIIRLPWLAVPFYGRSRVNLNVVDDNLFDFLRSQAVQQGGSTLPPGEIPNVIDHVDGGTGVFGSYARVSHEIVVMR